MQANSVAAERNGGKVAMLRVDKNRDRSDSRTTRPLFAIRGREIDPIRVVVWSLFAFLVIALWVAIGVGIWKAIF